MKKENGHSAEVIALSRAEKIRLEALEITINKGWECFLDVGRALLAIRDERLYRETHRTFEAYCKERCQMGRAYANRIIGTVEILEELSSNLAEGVPLPQNEAQARCLKVLNTEQRVEFWGNLVDVMDEEPLTAKKIREHLKEYLGQDKVDSKNGKSTIQNPKRFMRLLEMLVRELDNVSHKELQDRYQALYEETKEFLLREDR